MKMMCEYNPSLPSYWLSLVKINRLACWAGPSSLSWALKPKGQKCFFCSDNFNRIRSDPTQLSAAKAITRNPVTVISGRGGTGKTEVVTSTLNAIDKFFNDKVAWFSIATIATFDHENKVNKSELSFQLKMWTCV